MLERARLVILAATLLGASQVALATDPLTGRWEIDLARSKYDPGPPPKSAVRIQHLVGDALNVALEIILADGQSGDAQYTAKLDGKEHPVGRDPKSGTIVWTRADARTLEFQRKRDRQVVETGRLQVSEDGNEMTLASQGVNAAGQKFNDVVVYRKW
jgi:hypothetical protein